MKKDEVINIRDVSFQYDDRPVLEDVSVTINRGDFVGLIGPNGSGKSTLLKIILGLLEPKKGEVYLFGEPIKKFNHWEKIGFVSQKANSFNSGFPATVFEVVSMGLFGKIGLFRFLNREHKKKIENVIEQVGLSDFSDKNIGDLSGGQQQRAFIARALVSDPELLILDEPTVGVDTNNVHQFYELLKGLNEKANITLLLVSHDIGTMINYVTDVACLNRRLHFHGGKDDFLADHKLSSFHGQDIHLLAHDHKGEMMK